MSNTTTTDEIIEGNKLIAEFMGVNYSIREKTMKVTVSEKDEERIFFDCEWHPDAENISPREDGYRVLAWTYEPQINWCQLMPVVEKIESWQDGLCSFFIVSKECDIAFSSKYDIKGNELNAPNFKQSSKTKIESVWQAVVEFIKYYNQNK